MLYFKYFTLQAQQRVYFVLQNCFFSVDTFSAKKDETIFFFFLADYCTSSYFLDYHQITYKIVLSLIDAFGL